MRQWNPGHFGTDFPEGAPCPGEWHIRDESRVPPGHLNLFCVVKIFLVT